MPDITPTIGLNYLLLNYNNYFNRIIKKYETLYEYLNASDVSSYGIYTNRNFAPKDGVFTEVIENDLLTFDVDNANYLIVYDNNNVIISRWFIIDINQIRNTQYRLKLKRDVIADYYNQVIDATSYIEKAYINTSDVAIYNSEDISFNQIKKSETKLQDPSLQAWIVGYYHEPAEDKIINITDRSINQDITTTSISTWTYYNNSNLGGNTPYKKADKVNVKVRLNSDIQLPPDYTQLYTFKTDGTIQITSTPYSYALKIDTDEITFKNWFVNNKETFETYFYNRTSYGNDNITLLDGKIIYDRTTQKYYRIVVNKGTSNSADSWENISTAFSIDVIRKCLDSGFANSNIGTSQTVGYEVEFTNYTLTLTELTRENLTFTLKTTANKLEDAPYKMFAIPWNGGSIYLGGSPLFIGSPNPTPLQIAIEIARQLGTYLIDLQLLPFCPMQNIVVDGPIKLDGLTSTKDFDYVRDSETPPNNKAIVLYPKTSNFTFDINYSLTLPISPEDNKIVGQCDFYRLVSPNYAAVYEFNLLKTGNITKFNVDATYKPFAPYIKINPDWSRLYEKDYNDNRGLILSGDFSLPIANDAWTNYQINNKNYLNAFNRNIESIELRNKFAVIGDVTGAVAGTVGASVMGGVAGGVASGLGGAADIIMNQYLRRDALDLTKDQFNYSLENIKALPNTLAKVSSFDYNNKIFPLLEYYSCTDQEKEIFLNKMEFNGMKVMRIDKIKNFVTSTRHYIKAKIIRIDVCCNHLANDIANELNMGVYL